MKAALLALGLLAGAAGAQVPRPSDGFLKNQLADGETLETRVDGDLNGDGRADVAFVGRGEDRRTLYVMLAYRSATDMGHDPAGSGPLDPYPIGQAELKIARGVLTVEDMTGGTTATAATYRLRWDAAVKKMRLIGLDTTLYSRTYAHDGMKTSWNLLTGVETRQPLKLIRGGGGYADGATTTARKASKPVYIDKLPDIDGVTG